MRSACWGVVAAWLILTAGCWAAPVTQVDPAFASGAISVRTVDVLPVDVEVFSDPADGDRWASLPATTASVIGRLVAARLDEAGYTIASEQGWEGGQADGREPRSSAELQAISDGLAGYAGDGRGASTRPRSLELPRPLATTSTADASLYVGGWIWTGPHVGWLDVVVGVLDVATVVATVASPGRARWVYINDGRRRDDRARIYLCALLVDNATGRVLWRAHRTVEPGVIVDSLAKDIREIMEELPAAR